MNGTLPEPFAGWFAAQGWAPRRHQLAMLDAARAGESVLLIAPTGGGKTLAGFLPTLVALAEAPRSGIHTLYVSPLKALATDIARNLTRPVEEMRLAVSIETRTGDTPANRRARQRVTPPNILLTTPESLAVLLSLPDAPSMFAGLASVVMDEVHALAGTKRGDQLALCVARLMTLAPACRRVGLSATVAHPEAIREYVGAERVIEEPDGDAAGTRDDAAGGRTVVGRPHGAGGSARCDGADPRGRHDDRVRQHARPGGADVPGAVEAERADAADRAASRLARGGAAPPRRGGDGGGKAARGGGDIVAGSWHRLGWRRSGDPGRRAEGRVAAAATRGSCQPPDGRSIRAILVPANRFEVLECEAAMLGVAARELDGDPPRPGGLDVLAQHLLGLACAAPFHPDDAYTEVRRAAPYAELSRKDFDDVLGFVENGGYALKAYERWRKLFRDSEGRLHVRSERIARQHRMNIGTIVEAPLVKVRLVGKKRFGPLLGEIEEYFVNLLRPGDTFMFAGRLLRFLRLHENVVECAEGGTGEPMVPAYEGGRLPLTTNLANRVRGLLQNPSSWEVFPERVQDWLKLQKARSRLPGRSDLLVETFLRGDRWYLVAYCFEGRNAHQTLGMLLTRRMERAGYAPLGFVATDYVLGIWSAEQPHDVARLFDQDMLGDDLETWLAESSMLRRTFRNVAVIAGLIERHHPGAEKTRKQVTVNSDLIYDVLRRHQPDHILLRATRADAAGGLTDLSRIAGMLARVKGRVVHMVLSRVSPLAVPVLLEIGRESVRTRDDEEKLLAEAEAIIAEATGDREPPVKAIHRGNAVRRRPAQASLFTS